MAKKEKPGRNPRLFFMKWLKRLFGKKEVPLTEKARLVCMRQANTWCWPEHLGAKTEGVCSMCQVPIFFEAQNLKFKNKICHICSLKKSPWWPIVCPPQK